MDVEKIVLSYLKKNGFSGLCCADADCGCNIEDLFSCGENYAYCEPGYEIKDPTHEHRYIITTKNPNEVNKAKHT